MTAPTPIVAVFFSVIAGAVGVSLYFDHILPIWACILVILPIVALGILLESQLQNRAFKNRHQQDDVNKEVK